jgi:hypothetical protein
MGSSPEKQSLAEMQGKTVYIRSKVVGVMNSTYIHLRVSDSYIYMYRRGRIYKEPPEKIQ